MKKKSKIKGVSVNTLKRYRDKTLKEIEKNRVLPKDPVKKDAVIGTYRISKASERKLKSDAERYASKRKKEVWTAIMDRDIYGVSTEALFTETRDRLLLIRRAYATLLRLLKRILKEKPDERDNRLTLSRPDKNCIKDIHTFILPEHVTTRALIEYKSFLQGNINIINMHITRLDRKEKNNAGAD